MPWTFKPIQASWVIVADGDVSNAVQDPRVVEAAGARPSKSFHVDAVAAAEYQEHQLQISAVQRSSERFSLSVVQLGAPEPKRPLSRVAQAAFGVVLEERRPIAVGLNFVRRGFASGEAAGERLLRLLGAQADNFAHAVTGRLTGAGMKLYYDHDSWRVTLTLEPAIDEREEIVTTINYHREPAGLTQAEGELDALLGQTGRLYVQFAHTVEALLGEEARVAVH